MGGYFLPHFRAVFNYYLLKYFLMAFLSVVFFWDAYDSNVGAFNIVFEVREIQRNRLPGPRGLPWWVIAPSAP